jgi:predicted nucleic acid-binding protein
MKATATKSLDFVLDASVALSLCFEDEYTAYSEKALNALLHGSVAHVPSLFQLEVTNSLMLAERRKRISTAEINLNLQRLQAFPIYIYESEQTNIDSSYLGRIITLAQRRSLTCYDAAYLDLAMRLSLPLATLDNALKLAAKAEKISLL